MPADLLLALIPPVTIAAVTVVAYALGHRHGRAYVSDRTFGPVAAGLVRIEAASEALEVALDEPVPYWPVRPDVDVRGIDSSNLRREIRRLVREDGGDVGRTFGAS